MSSCERIRALTASLKISGLDAIFVSDPVDIRYLLKYEALDAWLLVTAENVYYITDGRYIEAVRKNVQGVTPVEFTRSCFEEVFHCCERENVRSLALNERHLTVYGYNRLKSFCKNKIKLISADMAVGSLRMIKDKEELRLMRKSLALDLEAYEMIKPWVRPGVSEREILNQFETFIRAKGISFAFDPIIASGSNSSYPHARVTDRRLRHNDPVLIDLGMDLKGYKSDLTRMFFLGRMPPSYKNNLALVRDAQQQAFNVIRPGVMAKDVDAAARNFLRKHGLAEKFSHSLGHGVGLEVHEAPRISLSNETILVENMVFTVEPGVYFPGEYGIRCEEMVLVTKKGCEVLSVNHDQ